MKKVEKIGANWRKRLLLVSFDCRDRLRQGLNSIVMELKTWWVFVLILECRLCFLADKEQTQGFTDEYTSRKRGIGASRNSSSKDSSHPKKKREETPRGKNDHGSKSRHDKRQRSTSPKNQQHKKLRK